MPEINYTNPQLKNSPKKELFILISLDGLSYSIHATETKQLLLFRYFQFQHVLLEDEMLRKVENIIESEDPTKENYVNVNIAFISQKSTLIPEEYFKPEYLKKYFEFSQNLAEYDELHYTFIPQIKAYNVFGLPNFLTTIFYSIQPRVKFHNQSTTLIQYGVAKNTADSVIAVVGLNVGFFDLILIQNNTLLLNNSFQFTNSADLLYFFLYTCKQLKFDPAEISVTVLGEASVEKNMIDELKTQVKDIEIPQLNSSVDIRSLDNNQRVRFYMHFLFQS